MAKDGPSAFYRGAIAQMIHEELGLRGGFLTKDDLAGYTPRVLSPLRGSYRGVDLAFTPGATGGITALEILNVLAQFPPARVTASTAGGLHLRAEAVRVAFLDRLRLLGDALRVTAPWEGLASLAYARDVARGLRPGGPRSQRTTPDPWRYGSAPAMSGSPAPRPVSSGGSAGAMSRPRRMAAGSDCTTHVGVVDRQRNMVSLTNTAVSLFGARMVVPGTGILLQNGMIWFDPEPGRINSIAPGKRPLVNMVPVLGFRKGAPAFTLGAPGGRKIVAVIPQIISNMLDAGDSPQAAMEAPRLHTEGGDLWVDDRAGAAHLKALARMKHPVVARHSSIGTFHFARPVAIRIRKTGLDAGLDPLSDASAAGA
ncbi:MAG: gamma-glutamyltransferase [Candidatus Rokubacteria bacterium]|nr:gamma-glutamyltransferase [Candidatus Rokubacteria bacterium]